MPSETVLKAATKDTTSFSSWVPFTASTSSVDSVRNIISLPGNNFMDFWYTGTDNNNPLPVKLISFNAKLVKNNTELNWSTAEEINNKGFEVERSINGINFERISFVKGIGNSATVNKYFAIDVNSFEQTNASTLYYRLKQVDFNGDYTYSNAVLIKKDTKENESISVYPNPFNDKVTVTVLANNQNNITLSLIDINGKEVTNSVMNVEPGTSTFDLYELNKLKNGIYFLRVLMENEIKTIKLVKTK